MRVVSVFGTRPEAIKMAPVIKALEDSPNIESIVCSTGQHREMLIPLLKVFDIKPDYDLALLLPGQNLNSLFSRTLAKMSDLFDTLAPDRVLVHGDTTTAGATALAAFHNKIAVGHVEAGLRTHSMSEPWPEELNRRLVDLMADQLYAPTKGAKDNLLAEHLGERQITVTGNTVIDALLQIRDKLENDRAFSNAIARGFPQLDTSKKLILVTGHRRESFGEGFRQFALALRDIASTPNVQLIYPVHLNPNVQEPIRTELSDLDNVFLIAPLDYPAFVYLMTRATLIISDSGGIQEEAPSLGKLVLVTRNVTERPEAVEAGTVELVGTDRARIVNRCLHYLQQPELLDVISKAKNPYGDGKAAQRIVKEITK
jgi:UDP-N-acetylglucosamine 2-epimerase (non-hydrolysing)